MGACQSCLGQRDRDVYDERDDGLLYDDDDAMHYGSFIDGLHGGDESIEAQRENEALQQVVAKTSSNMVDVFEIAPPLLSHMMTTSTLAARSTVFGYAYHGISGGIVGGTGRGGGGGGARVARYNHLVSKLSSASASAAASDMVDAARPPAGIQIEWFNDDDHHHHHHRRNGGGRGGAQNGRSMSLKTLDKGDGALVGTFADAATALATAAAAKE